MMLMTNMYALLFVLVLGAVVRAAETTVDDVNGA